MSGSTHFNEYTHNLRRVGLLELIDSLQMKSLGRTVAASLVVNPISHIPYGDEHAHEDAPDTTEPNHSAPN